MLGDSLENERGLERSFAKAAESEREKKKREGKIERRREREGNEVRGR